MSHAQSSDGTHPSRVMAVPSYPRPDTTVCAVTGELDLGTTPALRDVLDLAVCDENRHLVIDLSAVTSLDSTALHALFAARHQHDMRGGGYLTAVIDSDTGAIPKLYLVALEKAFVLHNTLAAALDACVRAGTRRGPAPTPESVTPQRRRSGGNARSECCQLGSADLAVQVSQGMVQS